MPTYEFRCQSCQKVSSFFTRSIGAPLAPACSHCGDADLRPRLSSFAIARTTQSVHQASAPGSADYYKDPRNIGRQVEESFQKHGVELPASVRETIQAAREGASPKGLDA